MNEFGEQRARNSIQNNKKTHLIFGTKQTFELADAIGQHSKHNDSTRCGILCVDQRKKNRITTTGSASAEE